MSSARAIAALKQAKAVLRGLTYSDTQIASTLGLIHRALDEHEHDNTTAPDAQLLRNLAEDVADMAPAVREHLRAIAQRIEGSEQFGSIRCRRCGEHADVSVKYARVASGGA